MSWTQPFVSKLSRHPVGYEVLVCSKALLGVIMGVSWLMLFRRRPGIQYLDEGAGTERGRGRQGHAPRKVRTKVLVVFFPTPEV